MDRDLGKGPFSVKAEDEGNATVRDQIGEPFAWVIAAECHGGDKSAAKARATRIAESLNRNDSLRAALVKARGIIQSERDTMVECATMPPHDDLTTLDEQTRPHVEAYDQALAEIDGALR